MGQLSCGTAEWNKGHELTERFEDNNRPSLVHPEPRVVVEQQYRHEEDNRVQCDEQINESSAKKAVAPSMISCARIYEYFCL